MPNVEALSLLIGITNMDVKSVAAYMGILRRRLPCLRKFTWVPPDLHTEAPNSGSSLMTFLNQHPLLETLIIRFPFSGPSGSNDSPPMTLHLPQLREFEGPLPYLHALQPVPKLTYLRLHICVWTPDTQQMIESAQGLRTFDLTLDSNDLNVFEVLHGLSVPTMCTSLRVTQRMHLRRSDVDQYILARCLAMMPWLRSLILDNQEENYYFWDRITDGLGREYDDTIGSVGKGPSFWGKLDIDF
ncbi:hypothetical protein C8F04DRAFT_1177444 [Mycena alexandri]|uniref:Uncharacterized protein n=1 Tax=Mycena alexandri TaxID=1745969 RepID=A0AAD6T8U0_9AGAR|nr:hypothetical protein C8F04DRAFT_1177444 [Mycena alexandri]